MSCTETIPALIYGLAWIGALTMVLAAWTGWCLWVSRDELEEEE